MKSKIVVYQYSDLNGPTPPPPYEKQEDIKKFEVEAWCVPGPCGILAFFMHGDYFYIAAGDDGHWRAIYYCHKDWKNIIKDTFSEFVKGAK